jgi:hypothetical protein
MRSGDFENREQTGEWTNHDERKHRYRGRRLWLPISQRPRLELRYSGIIFGSEIQQPLLGEGVGVLGETATPFCLFL